MIYPLQLYTNLTRLNVAVAISKLGQCFFIQKPSRKELQEAGTLLKFATMLLIFFKIPIFKNALIHAAAWQSKSTKTMPLIILEMA